MNTAQLERTIVSESLAAHIANCQICLLAPAMRDCSHCQFNVGLAHKQTAPVVDLDYPAEMFMRRRARFQHQIGQERSNNALVMDEQKRRLEAIGDMSDIHDSVDRLTAMIHGEATEPAINRRELYCLTQEAERMTGYRAELHDAGFGDFGPM